MFDTGMNGICHLIVNQHNNIMSGITQYFVEFELENINERLRNDSF